jgi:signal transduction histidine kinase
MAKTKKPQPAPRTAEARRRAKRPSKVLTPRRAAKAPAVAAPGRREYLELVRRVLTLQEAERRRIARDIHDDLGQQVTALRLKLEWLADRSAGDPELSNRVRGAQEAAERVDQHIDFLLRDLRPAGLDELGLLAVLRQTVAEWSATFGIAASFRATGVDAGRLPHEIETQTFRIVQEALNNVHKHAAATQVKVAVERRRGRTALTVSDNGIGLVASSASALPGGQRRGLGLLGMRERAMVIGGQLDITSTPGRGTTVTLLLP